MSTCFDTEGHLSSECYRTILQTMAEGVCIVDSSGAVRFCNRAMEHIAGCPSGELLGKSRSEIIATAQAERNGAERDTVDNMECAVLRSDGNRVPVLRNARILRDNRGERVGVVETLRDISGLKRTERRAAELEEAARRQSGFGTMIGHSAAIRNVFDMIGLAADSNATVLITGETGTGKELAARAIHRHGGRSDGPFVVVNCSALPEPLLESELFGHVRGAFTGAISDKIGRFESAEGGTVFLDEIGEISPLIQVKLLRFLQDHRFERVGESQSRTADVRIIAATNRDLRHLVRQGGFREDLYYRLKVFPIHMPPLRERKADIGLLVDHFVGRFNQQTGKSIGGLTHDAAVTIMDYCWPGNVRELENAIEHAFVTCREKLIGLFDLPLEVRRVELRNMECPPPAERRREARVERSAPRPKALGREELLALLDRFSWNRAALARHLGCDRTTLWRKMRRFGLTSHSRGSNEPPTV